MLGNRYMDLRFRDWVSLAMIAWLLLAGCGRVVASDTPPSVKPFLIYYGWIPGNKTAFHRMADLMVGYHVVVLGSGEEWAAPGTNHAAAAQMIATDRRTWFYGYVDVGITHGQPAHPLPYIAHALGAWRHMKARGVLLDCAGTDYGVSRARLTAIVRKAHQLGLRVLVNAWDPEDVVGVSLKPGDAWLAENWVIAEGRTQTPHAADWAALPRVRASGVDIWMTATDGQPPDRAWVNIWVRRTASAVGGSAIGVAGPEYSSRSNAIVPASWIRDAVSGF